MSNKEHIDSLTELLSAKDVFEYLFEKVPEAIVIINNNEKIVKINNKFTSLFGYERPEALGKTLDELLVPPNLIKEGQRINTAVKKGDTFSLETVRKQKNGNLINVSVIGAPIIVSGKQVGAFGIYRNVSDRVAAETALEKEKAFLEQLIESAQEAVVIADLKGIVLRINSSFTHMFGWQPDEAVGKPINDLIVPPELQEEGSRMDRSAAEGHPALIETIRQHKDKTALEVSLTATPIEVGGQRIAIYAIYRDISDRVRAERALKESEQRYRGFFENVPVGIFQTTREGNYLDANRALLKLFGFPDLETLKQTNASDFYSNPQERENWLEMMDREDVMLAQEFNYQRLDKKMIWVRESARTVRNEKGDILYYEGVLEDITPLKNAEQELLRQRAYLEQLIESAPEGIVLTEKDGQIIRINSEFTSMFGYSEEEARGQFVDDLIAPSELASEANLLTKDVASGKNISLDTIRRNKDGNNLQVSVIGAPIVIDEEKVGVFGIYRDISDRKKAEAEILENRQMLLEANQFLEQRKVQLEEANLMLEQLSNLDGLTGISNRRYFERFFETEWRRARRENKPITVMMIDVDFFKKYNDLHGHLKGDECLKKLANALQIMGRAGDLLARYGGEEFVVVLPNTDSEGAQHMSEIMLRRVKALQIKHGDSKVSDYLTVSIGLATEVPANETSADSLLQKADQALYQSKTDGRDRLTVYED